MTAGLLLDLDDTLYDYVPAEAAARPAVLARVAADTGVPLADVEAEWKPARRAVKDRLGPLASAHSRLLYLAELASRLGVGLAAVRAWEKLYWSTFLEATTLRDGALELLDQWRAGGHKIAIVTDLTLETQLWKLEAFALFDRIDVLVASEEVPAVKPARFAFELAITRLDLPARACVVVGDNPAKDGAGAEALGLPYFQAHSSVTGEGEDLRTIAGRLARFLASR